MTDVIVTMVKVADVNHLTLEVIDCFVTDGSHICWQMLLPYICKDRCYCPIVICYCHIGWIGVADVIAI